MTAFDIAEIAVWFPAFLLSITFHEAGHAWTSLSLGDRTAERQASLNPLPHIKQEPIGTLIAPVVSYFWLGWTLGWASAPYDPIWANRNPRRAGLMSLAGPAANLLLAGLALGAIWALRATDVLHLNPAVIKKLSSLVLPAVEGMTFLAKFLSVLYVLNLILFFFNLFPVPPLDGSGVIRGFFAGSAPARWLANLEERGWSLIGLILVWILFPRFFPVIWEIILLGLGH